MMTDDVPPLHTPLLQVVPLVQLSPSSQGMPWLIGVPLQLPFMSQMPWLQSSVASAHCCPGISGMATHWPLVTSHSPLKQPWESAEQSLGAPPRQLPIWQVFPTVHRSIGSVQPRPSLPICGSHMPFIGLQTATWQLSGTGKKKQSSSAPPL